VYPARNVVKGCLRVLVGVLVQGAGIPEPGGGAEANIECGDLVRVADEVESECLSCGGVVAPAGQLDRSTALESATISGHGVAQVLASLVGVSGGELLEPLQATALVGNLGDEGRDTTARVDGRFLESLVQMGHELGGTGAGQLWDDALQLSLGD